VLALSSICYGEKYPLGVMTNEQIIEKYFTGRTLDPIEGIWECEPGRTVIVVKVEALDKQKEKYAAWNYLVLGVDNKKDDASILERLIKTNSPFIYTKKEKIVDHTFVILSPMSMVEKIHFSWGDEYSFYVRIYPQVELKIIGN
jgi:predicted membrane chloride channel (bestrophin family)